MQHDVCDSATVMVFWVKASVRVIAPDRFGAIRTGGSSCEWREYQSHVVTQWMDIDGWTIIAAFDMSHLIQVNVCVFFV